MRRVHATAGACALLLLLNHRVHRCYPVGFPFLVCVVGEGTVRTAKLKKRSGSAATHRPFDLCPGRHRWCHHRE